MQSLQDGNHPWKSLIANIDVLKMAHNHSCRPDNPKDKVIPQSIVTKEDFKKLLIHVFAISILWIHFKNADDWIEGADVGNMSLTYEEFKLACMSLNSAQSGVEAISEEQMHKDYLLLDENKSNSITFNEVSECRYSEESSIYIYSMEFSFYYVSEMLVVV